ncbi:MAG: hypothetical protein ACOVRN_01235 [Flavobacterium sp.]
MKTIRTVLLFAVLSLGVGYGIYSVNSETIVHHSKADELGEIAFMALPVFLLLLFLNGVARMLKRKSNKKPSEQ